jgi:hypothetical protein
MVIIIYNEIRPWRKLKDAILNLDRHRLGHIDYGHVEQLDRQSPISLKKGLPFALQGTLSGWICIYAD